MQTDCSSAGVISMFEKRYCELNPRLKLLQYDIQDLYKYIDSMVSGQQTILDVGCCCCMATHSHGVVGTTPPKAPSRCAMTIDFAFLPDCVKLKHKHN